jgi:SAM-dependent MidA family methyltransferase
VGDVLRWREGMRRALYGPDGFFVRRRPAGEFRTSATASPLFGLAMARLVDRVDAALGRPARLDVVDIGAGGGELLAAVLGRLAPQTGRRIHAIGVDFGPQPDVARIEWRREIPREIRGVVLATEWLDNVPLDRAVRDDRGELAYLDTDGLARVRLDASDAAWVRRWWPTGDEVEIGSSRDAAWAQAIGALTAGAAVAVDYGHVRLVRPDGSTVTGYRGGRQVAPRLDGSTDVTAHVAVDSVAAAGWAVAGAVPQLLRQRTALTRLGISGARPPLALAYRDPAAYVSGLAAASEAHELTDPAGLGGHWWLIQPKAIRFRL